MELQTANFYIFIWVGIGALFSYILVRTHKKGVAKAEQEETEYAITKNRKLIVRAAIMVGLVILYAMVLPFRSDIDNYTGGVNFINTFEPVTEEDRYRYDTDLSDEARQKRLEELRAESKEISDKIVEESSIDNNTQGDNQ